MKTYRVTYSLPFTYDVRAKDEGEAYEKAQKLMDEEEIIVNGSGWVEVYHVDTAEMINA